MDILERLLSHDVGTTHQLLASALSLTDAQLDQHFDVGHETLRATFAHIIGNMEVWTALLYARPIPAASSQLETIAGFIKRLDQVAPDFKALAFNVRDHARWDETWTDTLDNPPSQKTYGGTIAHLLTHSHIHRGEVMHLLTRLGVKDVIEGDVLSWELQQRQSESSQKG